VVFIQDAGMYAGILAADDHVFSDHARIAHGNGTKIRARVGERYACFRDMSAENCQQFFDLADC